MSFLSGKKLSPPNQQTTHCNPRAPRIISLSYARSATPFSLPIACKWAVRAPSCRTSSIRLFPWRSFASCGEAKNEWIVFMNTRPHKISPSICKMTCSSFSTSVRLVSYFSGASRICNGKPHQIVGDTEVLCMEMTPISIPSAACAYT